MDGSPKQLNRTLAAVVSEGNTTYVCPCDVSIHIHVPCTICIKFIIGEDDNDYNYQNNYI